MAKGLASKLKTGALISAGLIALAGTPKADAGIVYDTGDLSVTNVVSDGKLVLNYRQTIDEVDTDGNGTLDAYQSNFYAQNSSQGGSATDKSFYEMVMGADLAGRGATNLTNFWTDWHYETTGTDTGAFMMDDGGLAMAPTWDDTFYYTISKDQVVDWENVNAAMIANDGAVSFGFQAPIAIPEPATIGFLALGGALALAGRRIKENHKYR